MLSIFVFITKNNTFISFSQTVNIWKIEEKPVNKTHVIIKKGLDSEYVFM